MAFKNTMTSFLFTEKCIFKMHSVKNVKEFVTSESEVLVPLPPCGIYFVEIDCHSLGRQLLWYWQQAFISSRNES